MNTRHLILQLVIAMALLACGNAAVSYAARHSSPRQVIAHLNELPHARFLAIGNSLTVAGFSEATFDARLRINAGSSVNAALGATMPVEHLLLAERGFQTHPHLAVVIYGFYDFQLTDSAASSFGDLFGNRNVGYYLHPQRAATEYFPNRALNRAKFALLGSIPMVVDRSLAWSKIELLRRRLANIGMPTIEKNTSMGRASDFSLLEATDASAFAAHCRVDVANRVPVTPAVEHLVQVVRSHECKLVFVNMPMTSSHRSRFYSSPEYAAYQNYLQRLVQAHDVMFIDAAAWASDAQFEDPLHLNATGATAFTTRLADTMATLGLK